MPSVLLFRNKGQQSVQDPWQPGESSIDREKWVLLAPQASGTSLLVATMAQLAVVSPHRWQRKALLVYVVSNT